MPNPNSITFTINFNDPDLDPEERDDQAQQLIQELRSLQDNDEIETVGRVLDPNPPDGSKSAGSFLVGLLSAEVNAANAKKVIGFLGDRLGGKPIELSVEGNG
ncbi:MAG TPA: hypothetical protein V6C88_20675, partial [Chroococcidiopsis sp.]